MSFDYSKIKGRMAELGITQKMLSEAIGVSENTISDKLRNGESFKSQHIVAICQKINIPSDEVGLYFFVKKFD